MFARWAKNAKAFTKVGKEISIAIKLGGSDPNGNPRLRVAIHMARSLNMPKDRIDAAVKRASSKDEESLLEVVYEGYAPHGVAMIVETATNNPTRTVANVRSTLTHFGGSLATTGSLDYLFQRRGVITIESIPGDADEFELNMIEHGLEDMFETESGILLYTSFEDYINLLRAVEGEKIQIVTASLQRFPATTVTLTEEQEKEIEKVLNDLEEDDDVQHVYHNMAHEG